MKKEFVINPHTNQPSPASIGIIMLDTKFPRITGDIGNPDSFDFPVQYEVVKGASPERIVLKADRAMIQPFIRAGRSLIEKGAKIVTTSCGFLALFQDELAQALGVPVFSSSLLQVHMAQAIIKKEQKVGIITAHKTALTWNHLTAVGIEPARVKIIGMETSEEFSSVFLGGKQTLDEEKCRQEMHDTAKKLIEQNSDIGSIVLECTNMPPYAQTVRRATKGLPLFDMLTMINYAHSTLGCGRFFCERDK